MKAEEDEVYIFVPIIHTYNTRRYYFDVCVRAHICGVCVCMMRFLQEPKIKKMQNIQKPLFCFFGKLTINLTLQPQQNSYAIRCNEQGQS